MKKIILMFAAIAFAAFSFAQNVGIGDTSPSAKLTIKGSETTADGQGAAIKLQNTSSSNIWFMRAGAAGTNTPANGFSIGDNRDTILL